MNWRWHLLLKWPCQKPKQVNKSVNFRDKLRNFRTEHVPEYGSCMFKNNAQQILSQSLENPRQRLWCPEVMFKTDVMSKHTISLEN